MSIENNPVIIDLQDKRRLIQLSKEVNSDKNLNLKNKEPVVEAIDTIQTCSEASLSPKQINEIYKKMNVDETKSPTEMDLYLRGNDQVAIVRKKFYDSYISKTQLETALSEIVSEFSNIISGNIIDAIIKLVKNFSIICATSETFNTNYRDLCFRFFSVHSETQEIIVLILNLHYAEISSKIRCLPIFSFGTQKVRLSFFGAVVKTSI